MQNKVFFLIVQLELVQSIYYILNTASAASAGLPLNREILNIYRQLIHTAKIFKIHHRDILKILRSV